MAGQGTPAVIADQEPGRPGGRTSILTRQRADHAGLDRLISRAWVNRGARRNRLCDDPPRQPPIWTQR